MITTIGLLAAEAAGGFLVAGTATAWLRTRLGRALREQLAD
ncbi:hypothetical protein [Saccharopolyspora rosea]|uniref:Uncharacterized protein n=1 Tax=Saccharopolyspora rosea TaxID=524884 RepID=A0ABW3FRQ0_9PSEU|nr:hypothetical protein [Saccharopolyspora rosea]